MRHRSLLHGRQTSVSHTRQQVFILGLCSFSVNLPGDSTMEIILLEIVDIGRGRVADMDLAEGVFAKVVSNPIQFGLALNLHLGGDAGVAANASGDEVEVDGVSPDLN